MPRAIGTLGTIDSVSVGGKVFTDIDNLFILAGQPSAAATPYAGAAKQGGASGTAYQVTAGKTLTISAIKGFAGSGWVGGFIDGGQSDNAMSMAGAAGPPTNPVYISSGGYSASFGALWMPSGIGTSGEGPCNGTVAATKYVFVYGSELSTILLFGYEA